ncbi:MAG: hypothetical protein Q7T44_00495 [Parvibaculum sp.]|nr:hypothetical protein [Parvibaculum sp.]
MNDPLDKSRSVALFMNDFEVDAAAIAGRLRDVRLDFRQRGDPHGTQKIRSKNSLIVWLPFYACESWDKTVNALIEKVGGVESLIFLLREVAPVEAWVQIRAPLNGSPYVESAVLSSNLMAKLSTIGLEFQVSVFDFDTNEPTHHPDPKVETIS